MLIGINGRANPTYAKRIIKFLWRNRKMFPVYGYFRHTQHDAGDCEGCRRDHQPGAPLPAERICGAALRCARIGECAWRPFRKAGGTGRKARAVPIGPALPSYPFRLSGTLPPLSASFCITALCKAIFSSAVPSWPTWTFNSDASSFRADKLESRSSSFSRSTIDVLQLPPPPLLSAMPDRTASTSTGWEGAAVVAAGAAGAGVALAAAGAADSAGAAVAGWAAGTTAWKIFSMMVPKMLMSYSNRPRVRGLPWSGKARRRQAAG